jgi:outer membrane protein assembly factor BamB/predicted Ser/Thr protein kinase
VAIKLVHTDVAQDAAFRARFQREVANARAVSGAFTAPVVDADVNAAVPWLVTAYLPGMSLENAVRAYGPLPVVSIRAVAIGLAEALVAIHRAGVVHRDLKPSNVILTPDGPRVIDFGIARSLDATTLTQTGAVLGTPAYMSPEQAGHGEVGPPADMFSLGGVLAYTATGSRPFGNGAVHEVLHRVVHEPPRLEEVADPWLRDVILQCMEKDASRRPDPAGLLRRLAPENAALLPHGTQWLPPGLARNLTTQATAPVPPAPGPQGMRHRPSRRLSRRVVLLGGAAGVVATGAAVAGAARLIGSGRPQGAILWTWIVPQTALGPTLIGDAVYVRAESAPQAADMRTGRLRWRGQVTLTQYNGLDDEVALTAVGGVGYAYEWTPGGGPVGLVALDLNTGRALWRSEGNAGRTAENVSPELVIAAPPVTAGMVCLPDVPDDLDDPEPDGAQTQPLDVLRAFDAGTGRPRWQYSAGEPIATPVTGAGGAFYFAGRDGGVHAVDAASGRRHWTTRINGQPAAAPVVAGRLVLVMTSTHGLYALDAGTGETRWEARPGGTKRIGTPVPVVADGTVYFGGNDGLIHAFDLASGTGRWTFKVGGDGNHYLPPLPSGRTVYVYNRVGAIYALDAATGRGRWRQPVTAALVERPPVERPVLAGGLVHIGGDAVYSFDQSTGRRVRKLETNDEDEPLGSVIRVAARGDVLYVLHDRASRPYKNISAIRARP